MAGCSGKEQKLPFIFRQSTQLSRLSFFLSFFFLCKAFWFAVLLVRRESTSFSAGARASGEEEMPRENRCPNYMGRESSRQDKGGERERKKKKNTTQNPTVYTWRKRKRCQSFQSHFSTQYGVIAFQMRQAVLISSIKLNWLQEDSRFLSGYQNIEAFMGSINHAPSKAATSASS